MLRYPVYGFDRQDGALLVNFFKMGLRDRFLGSALGVVWAIANPVLMLAIFTFVFGFVFKSRLPGAETSLSFVIWLISGYGPWLAISEGLSAATVSVVSNSGLVKNLSFKTELLPIAAGLLGLVPLAVSIVYLVVLLVVAGNPPSIGWLAIVPVLLLQLVFVTGIGLILAALNVFIRDVALALPNVLLIVLFASPIFYPIESFPDAARYLVQFNPFYIIGEGYRRPILNQGSLSALQLIYLAGVALLMLVAGLTFFRRLKTYFHAQI